MTRRVQIPAYTDRWIMGDQYGDVIKTSKLRKGFPSGASVSADATGTYVLIAHVQLDKSRKTIKVIDADCTEV